MKEIAELLSSLPWKTLLMLASGYAGYFVANVGVREHHKSIDVVFSTLVFGFFAALIYDFVAGETEARWQLASLVAFAGAVVLGALWSRIGRSSMYAVLRLTKVADTDELPSALASLFRIRHNGMTQVHVKLQDGSWLKCDDLSRFKDAPGGPITFGATGDLLIYVSHVKGVADEDFEECPSVIDKDWGCEMTYLPADQIARIDVRQKP
ncbi:MAG: hypothetical protein KF810_03015 [Rhizobiaceae bacterium]|nr:hypothetical protein [Rhizobiaceae bacterium]